VDFETVSLSDLDWILK